MRHLSQRAIAFAMALLLAAGHSAVIAAQDVEPLIRLGMTEKEVLYQAGLPDLVEMSWRWDDFQSVRTASTRVGSVPEYALTYLTLRNPLPVLRGPLGPATRCSVTVVDGRVKLASWTYRTKAGQDAKLALLRDGSYVVRENPATLIGTKTVKGGRLLAIVQLANDAETEVTLASAEEK